MSHPQNKTIHQKEKLGLRQDKKEILFRWKIAGIL